MIDFMTRRHRRAVLIAPAAVAGILLSACGSSTYSTGGYGHPSTTTSPSMSASGSGAEQIATAKGEYGTYLTADEGRAVYLWAGDSGSTSNCSSACASAWPPVLTTGAPKASGSAMTPDLGTVKRSDGGTQVTYKGHPLYYFAGDSGAGSTNGQGNNGFGAKWWLVSPTGAPITGAASSSNSGAYGGGNY
ncbi:hypothetical protein Back2_28740 [Nocardioides baekrokdamisoli]|uniref:Lipoprotein n=1 Tax=Nocardioides baekrokdamisoli TaxID=1804624 RepID=A0A3G9IHZ1_9ACTN|nr:hypothetical protein [Nocardioides baekrokdamisoli]BBH18587.1 hypothetical protein Back2_28740 [Nocardioides baekrokdamisoli]